MAFDYESDYNKYNFGCNLRENLFLLEKLITVARLQRFVSLGAVIAAVNLIASLSRPRDCPLISVKKLKRLALALDREFRLNF